METCLEQLAEDFDERDPAVKAMIPGPSPPVAQQESRGHLARPSDHPDFADWLAAEGIVSISAESDSVVQTLIALGRDLTRYRRGALGQRGVSSTG